MKRKVLIFFLLQVIAESLLAQTLNTKSWRKSQSDSMEKAQSYYNDKLFDLAVPIFINLNNQHPNETYLQYITAVSALERNDLHALSLDLLRQIYAKNIPIEDLEYNLARALHLNLKFDEALAMLEGIKSKGENLSQKQKDDIELLTVYCNNAKTLIANPLPAKIENLGRPPNTEASEYVPVLSADEQTMIYTYAGDSSIGGKQNMEGEFSSYGRYFEDVYITHKKDGVWQYGKNIGNTINTIQNDAAVSLSPDGHTLFTFRDDGKHQGDLYVSYLEGNDWSFPATLLGDVNKPDSWEGSCSISLDGKTLYFASDRKGGYGGRDLYKATKMDDGTWGNVKNMGDNINTKYDEDAPFIHPSGSLFIFSSNGEKSMGNYDIFKTRYQPSDSSWSMPENLGYPINSPDRDSYYVLSVSGEHGYYSSGKEGGQGLQDIYMITPEINDIKPDLMVVKGMITQNKIPVVADISATKAGETDPFSLTKSNETGKYLMSLSDGFDYTISFMLKNYPYKTLDVDGRNLHGYNERDIDIDFANKDSNKVTKQNVDTLPAISTQSVSTVNPEEKTEGLYFRVQIAAYKYPQNYNGTFLKDLGQIEKLELADGIYRITIGGNFYDLALAEKHLEKVRNAGQIDSFITAVYKGKRVFLDDLYKMGLLNKPK
ncbi:MAG: hypothetical protein ACYDCN_03255 [Bacteroidia bacterium]